MSRDESGALGKVDRLKRDVIDLMVPAQRGRLFKALGDGFLAEFSCTVEAVNCAVAHCPKGVLQVMRDQPDLSARPPARSSISCVLHAKT